MRTYIMQFVYRFHNNDIIIRPFWVRLYGSKFAAALRALKVSRATDNNNYPNIKTGETFWQALSHKDNLGIFIVAIIGFMTEFKRR